MALKLDKQAIVLNEHVSCSYIPGKGIFWTKSLTCDSSQYYLNKDKVIYSKAEERMVYLPPWRAPYLDGLAKAALAQHLPMDEIRRPKDAVRPADHTEGLGATQVLELGGRGAQRAGARGPVDAAAPSGETHQCQVPPVSGGPLAEGPLAEARPWPCPFPQPAMPHRCQSM